LKRIPCAGNVENRVKKSGYGIYHNSAPAPEQEYAVMADESMMSGSEKMMLIQGVDANRVNNTALTQDDISILNIAAVSSWNSAGIKTVLNETGKKSDMPPCMSSATTASNCQKPFVIRDMSIFAMSVIRRHCRWNMFIGRRRISKNYPENCPPSK
jgi:hypothetical protein